MAKKIKKSRKKIGSELKENMLPLNILPVGEHVEENKNIYILQSVYKEIHKFTKNKTTNESGGMLVGTEINEFGKSNIIISGFVEAKYCESTPTTLKFTHDTWEYVHKEIEKKHKNKKIVGWIHTHPDFGIFLSEYDKFIHQNFFNEDYQVAYVVDPIQKIEGFYFWINEKIEKCKGFYIYDRTGVNIKVDVEKEETEKKEELSVFNVKNIILTVLSVIVLFLIFSNISTNNKLKGLEKKLNVLVENTNHNFSYILYDLQKQSTRIDELDGETDDLKSTLVEVGIVVEPSTTEDETENNNTNDIDDTTDGNTPADSENTVTPKTDDSVADVPKETNQ